MTRKKYFAAVILMVLLSAFGMHARPTFYLAGDSTCAVKKAERRPECGWGERLSRHLGGAEVVDLALNGFSTKSFIDKGKWDDLLGRVQKGDVVLVQFGHNDEKKQDPARYTEAFGSFHDNLCRFASDVRKKGGRIVLLTPVCRRSFNPDGSVKPTHGDYPAAVKKAAADCKAVCIDMEARTKAWLEGLGKERSKDFFYVAPDGKQDNTHFNYQGADAVAAMVAEGIRDNARVLKLKKQTLEPLAVPDSLNILLFGHSYGADCTEHLPALLVEAGIRNVRIARFNKGNCSLEERWKLSTQKATLQECAPGERKFVNRSVTLAQVLKERPWDIVIFQTSLENAGRYETMQPWLDKLIDVVNKDSKANFGRTPELWWHCFWPISVLLENKPENERATYRLSFYGGRSQQMYEAYCKAAKTVLKKTAIGAIIPTGATIMSLRASELNKPEVKQFTRDGYHMSYGAGRYAAACTLFETLITPRYGVSVVGNPLRLPELKTPVTEANATAIQRAAAKAVKNPGF